MIIVLDYAKRNLLEPPLPPLEVEREEKPNRILTALFIHEDKRYEIDCVSLKNWTVMKFSNSDLGDVYFERDSTEFISSTELITEHYYRFLKRAIKQWKSQFPHH